MRINTNIAAMSAHRSLLVTDGAIQRSLGRLSSGFRINRAADDAAGLGIANKLRADTRSLKQAARNAEQANSMLQVMESAAGKVQSILERMKELATQAGSDNVDAGGRTRIDAEFQALREEITRIVTTTKFQGQTLVDGNFGNYVTNATGIFATQISLGSTPAGSYTIAADGTSVTVTDGDGNSQVIQYTAETRLQFQAFGISIKLAEGQTWADLDGATFDVTGSAASFMVSSSGEYTGADLVSLNSVDISVTTLGIDTIVDLQTADNARNALSVIDDAIGVVNQALGEIGAVQNRLEFALDNVRVAVENYAAAESTVRDADFAAEMMEFSKYQILQQAGVAMLAQANAAPQAVLALLR